MWVGCGSVCLWRRIEGVDDGEGFVERCVGGVGGAGRCRENCRLCRLGYGVCAEREGIGRMWVAVVLWVTAAGIVFGDGESVSRKRVVGAGTIGAPD